MSLKDIKQPSMVGERRGYVPMPLRQGNPVPREQSDRPAPENTIERIREEQAKQVRG